LVGNINFILIFLGIIILLERFLKARDYAFLSSHKKEDVLWFVINYILYPALLIFVAYNESEFISKILANKFSELNFTTTPFWLQFIVLLVLSDLLSYCFHRGFHSINSLWDLHRLHHSSTELTALSSFRYSWLDFFLHSTLMALSTSVLLVLPTVKALLGVCFMCICLFQHMNVKLKLPHFLDYLIITPKNHYWHHSKELKFPKGQNFGFIFPWWDRMFGTYFNPNHYDTKIGLSDNFTYSSLIQKFFYPLDKLIRFQKLIKFFNK
jgi:sterol desaturase/sphingolipid hydroxylase (fatty acid hydroxylase superfamily)